jgi:hypothetical protein
MSASTALTCTSIIITLEPCALNAEFQHFTVRFDITERGDRAVKAEGTEGEREADF